MSISRTDRKQDENSTNTNKCEASEPLDVAFTHISHSNEYVLQLQYQHKSMIRVMTSQKVFQTETMGIGETQN